MSPLSSLALFMLILPFLPRTAFGDVPMGSLQITHSSDFSIASRFQPNHYSHNMVDHMANSGRSAKVKGINLDRIICIVVNK